MSRGSPDSSASAAPEPCDAWQCLASCVAEVNRTIDVIIQRHFPEETLGLMRAQLVELQELGTFKADCGG